MEVSHIQNFSNNRLSYTKKTKKEGGTRFREMLFVYKTEIKADLEKVVIGDYYLDDRNGVKYRAKLTAVIDTCVPNFFDYIFLYDNGATHTVTAKQTSTSSGIYKEGFVIKSRTTDVFKVINNINNWFELYITPNGLITSSRA